MKTIKRIAALAVIMAATSTLHAAGCRTQYLNYVDVCANYTSGFREQGCYLDAAVEYVSCVGRAATT
jgi:hypothetical protein